MSVAGPPLWSWPVEQEARAEAHRGRHAQPVAQGDPSPLDGGDLGAARIDERLDRQVVAGHDLGRSSRGVASMDGGPSASTVAVAALAAATSG